MNCTKCGKPIADGAKFCSDCGFELISEKEDKNKPNKSKKIIIAVIAAAVVTALIVLAVVFVLPQKTNVEKIALSGPRNPIFVADTIRYKIVFYPEGETARVKYKSEDTSVASVDKNGLITAVGIGTTTITVYVNENISASVDITVIEDTPYNRLSENERVVVDLISKISYQFKNPDSINVTAVSKASVFDNYSCVEVCISAQNGFGGYSSSYYLITEDNGKIEITNMDDYYSLLATFNPIENIDIDGINEVLKGKV